LSTPAHTQVTQTVGTPLAKIKSNFRKEKSMSTSLKCPECQQIDKVSKVATVVESGTHRISGQVPVSRTTQDSDGKWRTETTYESYSAVQQTTLAQRLNPPEAPSLPPHMIGGIIGIVQKGVFYIYGGTIFFAGLAISTGPFAGAFSPNLETTSVIPRVLLFLLGIVTVPSYLGLAVFLYKKKVASEEKQAQQYYEKLKKWEYSMDRWNRLYYCSRDDCIFFPNENSAFPSATLNKVIDWHPEPVSFWRKLAGF